MDFRTRLASERLYFEGAMGTLLFEEGLLKPGDLPEALNITHSEEITNIHKRYINSGCNIVKTNTFGANRLKLSDSGYTPEQLISAGLRNAKEAARGTDASVALVVGPLGKLLKPFGELDFLEAIDIFAEIVQAGVRHGADLILIETMSDTYEIKAAILAAKENSELPIVLTFTPDEHGRLLTGGDILSVCCLAEGLGADAIGFNCGLGPAQMKDLIGELARYLSVPLVVAPNAGMPKQSNGKSVFELDPARFTEHMLEIAPFANILGGCCGTTPEHMETLISAVKLANIPPKMPERKKFTAVSSYGKTVVFGDAPLLIGERINPTGKPKLKRALREGDMSYILSEGLSQVEYGADILDVNAGLADIDEREVLAKIVTELQSVTATPLQIDTSDPKAADLALRLYNGKPLLNSINGKRETLEAVLPLVKKYGTAVAALTLDENGIPETAEGRLRIAENIVCAAESFGIPKENIIIDTLVMTVSTDPNGANVTLEAMELVRKNLGVHTLLGLSNVSFGLPEREKLNAAFFQIAMSRGLSAGIVNPKNSAIMDAYYTYRALNGSDGNCADYIARFSAGSEGNVPLGVDDDEITISGAIMRGLAARSAEIAAKMLEKTEPLEIINSHLIPALDEVGKAFEAKTLYLPQLLMSAEAARSAFETVKKSIQKGGALGETRGKIILATVFGDIHDIGKNIVKILLENYNYEVIDLGKNVPSLEIVEHVVKHGVKLVGLSALMTTTVVYMEEAIRLLREAVPDCKIMVGGAVLTEEYAKIIGADFYSKDAVGSVRCAERIFNRALA